MKNIVKLRRKNKKTRR